MKSELDNAKDRQQGNQNTLLTSAAKIMRSPRVVTYLLITLPFLIGLFFASGPILEGYSINLASRNYMNYFPSMLGRPLALLPEYFASYISGNDQFGYFLIGSMFALVKFAFVVVYCRNSSKIDSIVLLIMVLTIAPWMNFANERYFAAQLSLTFVLAALFLENGKNPKKTVFVLRFLAGMSYPPICFAALLSWVFSFSRLKQVNGLRSTLTSQLGTATFLLYFLLIKEFAPASYDSQATGTITFSNIVAIYKTLLNEGLFSSLLTLMIIVFITIKLRIKIKLKIFYAILLCASLPLASLGYAFNLAHVNDPHRVIFPIASLLCLIAVPLLTRNEPSPSHNTRLRFIIAIGIISFSGMSGVAHVFDWNNKIQLNNKLVNNLASDERIAGFSSILVIDKTEYFGDVYSMLNDVDVLNLALTAKKINTKTVICNSIANYARTFASKYPIPAAKECSKIDLENFSAVLVVEELEPFETRLVIPPYKSTVVELLEKN